MDNYKIKVKDEQNFKEVVSLINTLGYGINFSYSNASGEVVKGLFLKRNGLVEWTHRDTYFDFNDSKELTLPQLRDLVVLKRNDVRDATHADQDRRAYLDSDGKYHFYIHAENKWEFSQDVQYVGQYLKPIKDPALISGAEAKLAWANGVDIQIKNVNCVNWYDLDESKYNLDIFDNVRVDFRLKPQTIKLELELPKPFEPEEDCHVYILDDGKTDGYRRYFYEVHGDKGNEFIGIWKTEDEIKQVVAQLRKIRGTNS
ncbi:hypothetical protein [Acinetobacter baumannii]|uniref:hypothetical protein n=1 Tax=Acinetobacter baumannii TaxID=470 RepID=UPI003AF469F8